MDSSSVLAIPDISHPVIRLIHYVYPLALLVWFVAAQAATICTLANLSAPSRVYRKRLFVVLQLAVISTYVSCLPLPCMQMATNCLPKVIEAALMCLHNLGDSQGSEIKTDKVVRTIPRRGSASLLHCLKSDDKWSLFSFTSWSR